MGQFWKKKRRRRSKTTPVREEMRSLLKKLSAHNPAIHPEIWARWTDIVGGELAKRTYPRALHGRTLLLAVASSAWMNELVFLKRSILERLAEEVGPNLVKDIRLVLDPAMKRPVTASLPARRTVVADTPLPSVVTEAIQKVSDPILRETILKAARASIRP